MSTETDDKAAVRKDFNEAVNMSPSEIEHWLDTDDSKKVGSKGADGDGSGESVGHASGRHIVRIKKKAVADLTDGDYAHMKKVVGYVHRHLAQRPADPKESRWRYSEPWYFGVRHGMAVVYLFRPQDKVRITQSPSGGGAGNPAWDFQYFIPQYEVDRRYQMVMRMMYLAYETPEQIERASRPHLRALGGR